MKRFQAVTWFVWVLAASMALAEEVRKIEVRATGEATAAADELTLPIEVVTSGGDFAALKQRNDLLLGQLLELLATQKVQRPMVETTWGSFDFSPMDADRDFQGSKGQVQQAFQKPKAPGPFDEPKQAGAELNAHPRMHLSRRLTVRFASLSQATELLAKLTTVEAVKKSREIRFSHLSVGVKEGETHQSRARTAAVQNALKKAQLLAEASNLKLGPALSIVDETTGIHAGASRLEDPFGASPFGPLNPRVEYSPHAVESTMVVFQPEKEPPEAPAGNIQFSVTLRVIYEATLPK